LDKCRAAFATAPQQNNLTERRRSLVSQRFSLAQHFTAASRQRRPSTAERIQTGVAYEKTPKTSPAVPGGGRKTAVPPAAPPKACTLPGQAKRQKRQAEKTAQAALKSRHCTFVTIHE